MAGKSKIQWTEHTWNPIVGCSVLTPGCTNCYAMKMAGRLEAMGQALYAGLTKDTKAGPVWNGKVRLAPEHVLIVPLRRKKPTTYFVNSMGDLFHEDAPDEWIDKVFAVMALCPQHTFQVLTKRVERMREYLSTLWGEGIENGMCARYLAQHRVWMHLPKIDEQHLGCRVPQWPLPNVWLGVSAERQHEADERIPHLLQTPAAIRFVSAEPLLGPMRLRRYLDVAWNVVPEEQVTDPRAGRLEPLDWVIAGGESGPGARPMDPNWPRKLRDDCEAFGVAFFFKQWGEFAPLDSFAEAKPDAHVYRVGKKRAGRLLDGREHNDMPSNLPSALAGTQNKNNEAHP